MTRTPDDLDIAGSSGPARDTIVVVDPEHALAPTFAPAFCADRHEVICTSSAADAHHLLSTRAPGLLIIDGGAPDALELVRQARSGPVPSAVIITAAGPNAKAALMALEHGVAWLPGPLDVEQLRVSVGRLLERQREEHARRCRDSARERRTRELEALLHVATALTSTLDLKPLLKEITQRTAQALGVDRASVSLFRNGLIVPMMSQYADGHVEPGQWEKYKEQGLRRVDEQPIFAAAIARRAPVVVEDAAHDPLVPAYWTEHFAIKAAAAVPLIRRGEVIGVLNLVRTQAPGGFSEEQLRLATTIAAQVALAIDNAHLYKTTERRLQDTQALLDIARTLSSSLDLRPSLSEIAQRTAQACRVERCSLYLVGGGQLQPLISMYADGHQDPDQWARFKKAQPGVIRPPHQQAVLSRAPVTVTDAAEEDRTGYELFGTRAHLVAPLIRQDEVIGLLSLTDTRKPHAWTQAEIDLAMMIGSQMALAVENSRLYADTQRRLRETTTLLDIAQALGSTLDLKPLLKQITQRTAQAVGFERASIFLWRDGRVHPVMSQYADGRVELALWEAFKSIKRFRVDEVPALAEAMQQGQPVIIEDAESTSLLPEWWRATFHMKTVMIVPLIRQGVVIGALQLGDSKERTRVRPAQVDLATTIASQVALAIDNARLFEESEARRQAAEGLAEVGRVLSQALEPGEVAQRIADSVCRLLGCQSSALYDLEPSSGGLVRLAVSGDVGPLGEQVVFPKGAGVIGLAVREREPVTTPDLLTDSRVVLTPELRRLVERAGHRAVLAVPLLVQDRVIGALAVGDKGGRQFDRQQIQLTQAFADQAALALENARLYAEAKHAYEELSRAQTQLVRVETLRAVGELAAGASHHLNNLLAVVVGRVQLALKKFKDPELRRQLLPAERAALDGADVVARLSRFSRRQTAPTLVSVDLNELAAEVIELTRPRWQNELVAKGITIDVSLEPGAIPEIAGDPPSLREVLVNLILNATDAMPSGGRITITTWAAEGSVSCRVSDTGIGMSAEVQRRVLEPFFTTKGVKSTGLGLSVNYGIIQRHNGELTIESVEGRGTDVTFRLPAARGADKPQISLPHPSAPPLRILLVDDENEVRTAMADMLEADGHAVIAMTNGPDAVARFLSDPSIDLVLTDLAMPGMTGWELARAVKAARPSLVVGIITGWGAEPEAKPEVRASADFVLSKPITEDGLRRAVAHARGPRGDP